MKTNRVITAKYFACPFGPVAMTTGVWLLLCSAQVHAQGGVPLWTNRYLGPISSSYPIAAAADSNGSVFVTGSAMRVGSLDDYVTIKYSRDGVPQWTNYYNGPANGYDNVYAIAVDSDGDVLVTGTATIKYSGLGVPMWTNFPGGETIAVDSSNNVFISNLSIAGHSATIKYSGLGIPLWTNFPGGNSIAVNSSGDVIVLGASSIIKYSSAGTPLWTNSSDTGVIAFDPTGNVFAAGSSPAANGFLDYLTIKYSGAGVPLWTNRYNGPANSEDEVWALAVDSGGNVFVTGQSYAGVGECCDYTTVKYSNTGVPVWTRRYNGPGNSADIPHAIALDTGGNVIVTGDSYGTNGSNDYAAIAYSNAGVPLWTNRFPVGRAGALALDHSGNVFVAGTSGIGNNSDIVTIKYSSSVPPSRLAFEKLNNQLVLSWTNAGFTLQSAPVVPGTFTNIPGATSPYTNPITGAQQFFRLIGN